MNYAFAQLHLPDNIIFVQSLREMKRYAITLILLLLLIPARGQTGGDNTYEFLNLGHSAFAAATGGFNVSRSINDLSLTYFNPALLTPSLDDDISLSYSAWFAGINYGYASYAMDMRKKGTVAAGLSFISYGRFTETDIAGNINGSFTAAEYAFNLLWSFQVDTSFTVGINLKPVFSHLERYFSAGLCADIGARYHNERLMFDAGLVIRNSGFQIKSYTGDGSEPLPFEIIAGASKRLAHAPFCFTLTVRHIEKPDLTFDYNTEDDISETGFGENILRHMILGIEIIPSDLFWIGAGLNYQRRAEMRISQRTGMTGFSAGFGIMTKAFDLSYGRDALHLAGASNHLTVTLRPEYMVKNKKP
jgi:hypothetical protein